MPYEDLVVEMASVLEAVDTILYSIDSDGLRLVDSMWDSFAVELTVSLEAVETAMSRCLSDPMLAPFVNEQGVRRMLIDTRVAWLESPNWATALRERREACTKEALDALAKLPPELEEFQRCATETLHGTSFPSNSWRTFEWPDSLNDVGRVAIKAFLVALRSSTLPELASIVLEVSRELEADTSSLVEGHLKVKELQEMAAWYKSTSVAAMEWSRELRRREQWQAVMDQRVSAVKKELTRLCDEEALERSEFYRLWRPFLPRGGGFATAHTEQRRLVPTVQISVE